MLVVLAVLLHQKACLIVLPLGLLFGLNKRWKNAVAFALITGGVTLAVYLFCYSASGSDESFVGWLTRYHQRFSGMGSLHHVLEVSAWGGIAWNVAAGWFGPLIDHRDMVGAAVGLGFVAALFVVAFRSAVELPYGKAILLHLILFEAVLFWLFPALHTMQYFSYPMIAILIGLGLRDWRPKTPVVAYSLPCLMVVLLMFSGRYVAPVDVTAARAKVHLIFEVNQTNLGTLLFNSGSANGLAVGILARDLPSFTVISINKEEASLKAPSIDISSIYVDPSIASIAQEPALSEYLKTLESFTIDELGGKQSKYSWLFRLRGIPSEGNEHRTSKSIYELLSELANNEESIGE